MAALVEARGVRAIVDVGHPYADKLHATAREVAQRCQVHYLAFVRPGLVEAFGGCAGGRRSCHSRAGNPPVRQAGPVDDRLEEPRGVRRTVAADRAGAGGGVLDWRRRSPLAAAGHRAVATLAGRGPFSVEENRRQIRPFRTGVVVAKDSGRAGGTPEKLEAARLENCQVIVVRRPAWIGDNIFSDLEPLLEAIGRLVPLCSPSPSGRGTGEGQSPKWSST